MRTLPEIIESLESPVIVGDADAVTCSDIFHNSSQVTPGSLFCCIVGESTDGHDFAADAVARGAAALLVEREMPGLDVPQIVVPSVREVVGPVASLMFGEPSRQLQVIGITGTNGKTTTSHLVQAILEASGRSVGLIGTIGAKVGDETIEIGFTTPEAVELQRLFRRMLDAGNDCCVMEVSSHALDQRRTVGTRFAAVAFTNLTRDHLDYHKSFEAYFMAKRRLFDSGEATDRWPAAINCDDEWGCRLFDELVHSEREDIPVWGYTVQEMVRASVSAKYLLNSGGASVTIESPVGDYNLQSQLRGRFNVENVLCAATIAMLLDVTPAQIQLGLSRVYGVPGRFEPVECGQNFDVFVDYAHTPDSLEQVLASARDIADGEVIVVFGCGGDRDRTKRPHMGRIAAQGADHVIITSDNPRSEDPEAIIVEIQKGVRGSAARRVHVEVDRREAIRQAFAQAEAGDVVVIAGKGHERGQTIAGEVFPFDDVEVAREALGSLAAT